MTMMIPEKPQKKCEHCDQVFEYRESDRIAFMVEEYNRTGKTPRFYAMFYWSRIEHEICNDILRNKEKIKQETEILERRFLESNIPRHLLEEKTFASFENSPGADIALRTLQCWLSTDEWGVFLRGNPGCGKTHLLIAFARQWMESGLNVFFERVADTFDSLRQSYEGSYETEISKYKNIRILIWDDLGTEKPSEWVEEKFHQIIDHRLSAKLPTFFSSNCSMAEIKSRVHERILSRLKEAATIITIESKDRRNLIYEKRNAEIAKRIKADS